MRRVDVRAGMSGGPDRRARWLERRDAARHDGVSWGPQPEAHRPRKGRGPSSSPAHRPSSRAHIRFFRRTRPLRRTRSVHSFPTGPGPGPRRRRRSETPPRGQRPSQGIVSRLVPGRVTPSWSSPAATSLRRRPAGTPEGKESLRHDHRLLVARSLDRRRCPCERFESGARLARLPRRMVRPVPARCARPSSS